jgi:hypothetical protein
LRRALSLHWELKSGRKRIMQNLEGFDILRKELHQYSHKGPTNLKPWQ